MYYYHCIPRKHESEDLQDLRPHRNGFEDERTILHATSIDAILATYQECLRKGETPTFFTTYSFELEPDLVHVEGRQLYTKETVRRTNMYIQTVLNYEAV